MALTAKVMFIDGEYWRQYSAINGQVDDAYLKPHIIAAQDKYLHRWLGTALYSKLKTDSPTFSGAYSTLMDTYVRDVVLWWTVVESLPHLRVKVQNGTLATFVGEDWQGASEGDMKRLVDHARGNAMHYTQLMVDYLCNNASSFPEYVTASGAQRPAVKRVYGGMTLDISCGVRDSGKYSDTDCCGRNFYWRA